MPPRVPKLEFENTVLVLLDGKEIYRVNVGGERDYKDIDQNLDAGVYHVNSRLRDIRFHAAAQFAHRLFPDLRVLRDVIRGHRIKRDTAGPVLHVVAIEAVGLDGFPVPVCHVGRRRGGRGTRCGAHPHGQTQARGGQNGDN